MNLRLWRMPQMRQVNVPQTGFPQRGQRVRLFSEGLSANVEVRSFTTFTSAGSVNRFTFGVYFQP